MSTRIPRDEGTMTASRHERYLTSAEQAIRHIGPNTSSVPVIQTIGRQHTMTPTRRGTTQRGAGIPSVEHELLRRVSPHID